MKLPKLPLEIINKILYEHKGIQTPSGKIMANLINNLIPEHEKIKEIDEENYTDQFIIFYFETYFGMNQSTGKNGGRGTLMASTTAWM